MKDDKKLVPIKTVTLKIRRLEGTKKEYHYILANLNYRYPFLFEPKFEKLIVSVNGVDTELKL